MYMKKVFVTVFTVLIVSVSTWYMSQPGFFADDTSIPLDPESAVWQDYVSPVFSFSIKVPPGYTVDASYRYEALGPEHDITGVSFTVPEMLTQGTNLSQDSYVSVERLRDASCVPSDFLDSTTDGEAVSLGDKSYLFATSSGVGAGNLYEEGVYMKKVGAYCYGIRLFMHSTNIYNYDPGTVTAFDREALIRTFELMASTVTLRP